MIAWFAFPHRNRDLLREGSLPTELWAYEDRMRESSCASLDSRSPWEGDAARSDFDASDDSFTFSGISIAGGHIDYVDSAALLGADQASAHLQSFGPAQ
ncbi:hypothetical protein CWO91_39250 [Bradyrhizobium genosp. SA-3]|uniref:hypothetical protein n=1 Tax=Bradyrhizobium genosp. SA-3 TaxID=508868 RepID=UPI0010290B77|nr:hypothetical protein [Bradyrhizobium genosp. SA-3]RZM94755.1 hypothetical protein CWO91_39250 [Bradyrhizobium genosp. SA-3]